MSSARVILFGSLHIRAANRSLIFSGSLIPPLLGYLALHAPAGRAMPRTLLAERLWPHLPGATARIRLSDALYRLRQSLDVTPEWLEADHSNIRLTNISSDVAEFKTLAASESLNDWKSAIECYTGELLDGIDAEWLLAPRIALRDLYLTTLAKVCDALIKAAHFADALAYAHRWMIADPFNETSYQVAMRLASQLGRHAEALQAYDRLVELLEEEFQSSPLPETRTLANTIRAAYHTPTLPSLPQMLGREAERAALLRLFDRAQGGQGAIVLLEGTAGAGKSHLINVLAEEAAWRQMRMIGAEVQASRSAEPFAPLENLLRTALRGVWGQMIQAQLAGEIALAFGQPQAREKMETAALAAQFIQAIQALGDAQAHIFVLEGMHLAAPALWQLICDCAPAIHDSGVLFVLSYRGRELRAHRAAWRLARELDRERLTARIVLGELSRDACAALARLSGASDDPVQLATVHRRSGGNALLAQALAQAAPGDSLPPAAWEWARQQCALLPTPALRLLEWLSVLEAPPAYATLNGLMDVAMLAQIPVLLAEKWLFEQQGTLAFCTGLVRDYIYANLPPARRRAMHAKAARHLAWLGLPPEQYASHYERAEYWLAASAAFGAAGSMALEHGEAAEACYFYGRALSAGRRAGSDPIIIGQLESAHAAALRQASLQASAHQPIQIGVELARLDAPLGRALASHERVIVRWTLHAGVEDMRVEHMQGKIALRRARIIRLLAEARAQGAAPTDRELAQALGVSQRTIIADITALRAQGIACATRRRR